MNLQETQGELFGMRQSQANQWIHVLLSSVKHALTDCGELPARQMEALRLHADNSQLLLHDGTARAINRPNDQEDQELYYNGKQEQHTIKNDVIIDATCTIHFLTETVKG